MSYKIIKTESKAYSKQKIKINESCQWSKPKKILLILVCSDPCMKTKDIGLLHQLLSFEFHFRLVSYEISFENGFKVISGFKSP